ncbi:hypothetical protein GCM10018771_65700 [Streptomyces cellulosae]|nr:hypothetical protein GCM10018771_65700 [Streptomyces cellulosae]
MDRAGAVNLRTVRPGPGRIGWLGAGGGGRRAWRPSAVGRTAGSAEPPPGAGARNRPRAASEWDGGGSRRGVCRDGAAPRADGRSPAIVSRGTGRLRAGGVAARVGATAPVAASLAGVSRAHPRPGVRREVRGGEATPPALRAPSRTCVPDRARGARD